MAPAVRKTMRALQCFNMKGGAYRGIYSCGRVVSQLPTFSAVAPVT